MGDPMFALTLAENLPLGAMNLIDYIVMTSADVGDGLGRVARYAPLMGDAERLTLTVRGDEARFRFHNGNDIPYPIPRLLSGHSSSAPATCSGPPGR